jgi:hypothetical protein
MIDKKLPNVAETLGKNPKKAVLHNLRARHGLATLPPPLEWRRVGLHLPAYGNVG